MQETGQQYTIYYQTKVTYSSLRQIVLSSEEVEGVLNKNGSHVSGELTFGKFSKYSFKVHFEGTIKKEKFNTYYMEGSYENGELKIRP